MTYHYTDSKRSLVTVVTFKELPQEIKDSVLSRITWPYNLLFYLDGSLHGPEVTE